VVAKRTTPLADFGRVFGWAEKNLTYDHDHASLQASSLFALTNRRGHCSDYHSLCASLGRAMGYPTRVTYGLNTFSKNSPSHCKLEVFLPPYGWVSFDVSETQKLIAAIQKDDSLSAEVKTERSSAARRRLLSGFRDNTWFVQTRGTDYELAPPASQRVPVVRTIYAEADGVPLPDPDPANKKQTEFAWMTILDCQPDHAVSYPFNP
jgi:transglutaminase-like putative cysteine protease